MSWRRFALLQRVAQSLRRLVLAGPEDIGDFLEVRCQAEAEEADVAADDVARQDDPSGRLREPLSGPP